MKTKPIGILGGTFDPIHAGHLRLANELFQCHFLQEVRLVPCRQPVLPKEKPATAEQRLAMLKIAIAGQPGLIVDEREIKRDAPSYTVDTLLSLRQDFPDTPLCLIMGIDALIGLDRWYQWQKLLDLAHIIVVPRSDYVLPTQGPVAELLKKHLAKNATILEQKRAGAIYIADLSPVDISSTAIRRQIHAGKKPDNLLPKGVWDYIEQQKLYQK